MDPIVNIYKDIAVVSRTISLKVNNLDQIINSNFKYLRLRKFIEKGWQLIGVSGVTIIS